MIENPVIAERLWTVGERLAAAAEAVYDGAPGWCWGALDEALNEWEDVLDQARKAQP